MVNYNNYKITDSHKENYYSWEETFTRSDGFHVAAGIIDLNLDPSLTLIEDPEIGHLKFYIKEFVAETGKLTFTELSTRYCQLSDFNDFEGTNKESKFFKVS